MATPLFSALLGLVGAWVGVGLDRRKAVGQELTKKRIAIYDDMVPLVNDIFCFLTCRGSWRNLDPTKVLAHKRELDRLRHVYGALFSVKWADAYEHFIATCFIVYVGRGKPALLRANTEMLQTQWGDDWDPAWQVAFSAQSDKAFFTKVRTSYDALVSQFAREIGVRSRFRLSTKLNFAPKKRE